MNIGQDNHNYRHGHAIGHGDGVPLSPTYHSWNSMMTRCNNPNRKCWPRYGGKGIKVCERWTGPHGFENFLADMGERPKGTTLDRIDANLDYDQANCRWATAIEQNRHGRKLTEEQVLDIFIRAWSGEKYTDIANSHGIGYSNVSSIKRGVTWSWLTNPSRTVVDITSR